MVLLEWFDIGVEERNRPKIYTFSDMAEGILLNLCFIRLPSRSFTRRLVFIYGEQGLFAKMF
jgi:hypothetical protein